MTKSLTILGLLVPTLLLAYYNPGLPGGFVNDYVGLLNPDERQTLENKLKTFEKDTSNEIAIVTIPSLQGDTVENFAVQLFKDWGVGKKGKDNGILMLVARDDRQARIEVGYGLEGALTDAQSFWILDNIVVPAFKNENYYAGIDGAVDKIIAATKGEYVPSSSEKRGSNELSFGLIFWFALLGFIFLARILGSTKSWWLGGVIGGLAALVLSLFIGFLYNGLIALVIFTPLGLLFDFLVSRHGQKMASVGRRPWWWGGPRIGGGGGGFGGFGGGHSGGGGSSRSW